MSSVASPSTAPAQGHDFSPHQLAIGLSLQPAHRQFWAGLGLGMQRDGQLGAAKACYRRSHCLEPQDASVTLALATVLLELNEASQALDLLDRVILPEPLVDLGIARQGLGLILLERFDEAQVILAQGLERAPGRPDLHSLMAEALLGLGRQAEMRRHQLEAMRLKGGAVEIKASGVAEARILFLCSVRGADLPIDFMFDGARFDMIFVYPAMADGPPPPHDVVFNAIADPDLAEEEFDSVADYARRHHLSLVNPPLNLPRTRRDKLFDLVRGMDGLIVPHTIRLSRAEIEAINRIDGAKLVRTAGTHGGEALERVETAAELADFVAHHDAAFYYLTDYVDYRSSDGYFRKYRFIFIDRKVHSYHLAIMDHWKVHYWRADMVADQARRDEEEAFMRGRDGAIPAQAFARVEEIGRRLDLDYAGLDCSLMADGRLVIFEANAAMLVHLNDDPKAYPYKHELVPHIRDAMSALILDKVRQET
jgi:tetratricopeptide (TPR) repeat protein